MNHRARPLPADWPTRPTTAPQGRPEQGWPVRRCTATPAANFDGCGCSLGREVCNCAGQPAEAASACAEIGCDEGEPLSIAEAVRFWAWVCVPAFAGVIGFAAVVWAFKP